MKSNINISLDSEAKKILEKRAKENLLDLDEMISDILRRSALSYRGKSSPVNDNVDDKFLTYFSRKTRKR